MNLQFITTTEELERILKNAIDKALEDHLTHTSSRGGHNIIDTKTLCAKLSITEPTVIRWRKKGKIPFLQIGSAIRFDLDAVLLALEVSKKKGGKQ